MSFHEYFYFPFLNIKRRHLFGIEDFKTGKIELEDTFKEEVPMDESDAEKYLGDILSTNGSNTKNIEARTSKGHGSLFQIGYQFANLIQV